MPTAQALAARLEIPLHLITAIDKVRFIPAGLGPVVAFDASVYQETAAQLDASANAQLAAVGERLEGKGLDVSSQVVHGSPFMTIADAVQDGDLLVMTSHGRSGVRRWLLGSVAEKLVREAPVPVILVPVAARQAIQSADIARGAVSVEEVKDVRTDPGPARWLRERPRRPWPTRGCCRAVRHTTCRPLNTSGSSSRRSARPRAIARRTWRGRRIPAAGGGAKFRSL